MSSNSDIVYSYWKKWSENGFLGVFGESKKIYTKYKAINKDLLKKTILLVFKNKNKSFLSNTLASQMLKASVKTGPTKLAPLPHWTSMPQHTSDSVISSLDLSNDSLKAEDNNQIKNEQSDILYNCILEGLRNSLDHILDSRANKIYPMRLLNNDAFRLKKVLFPSYAYAHGITPKKQNISDNARLKVRHGYAMSLNLYKFFTGVQTFAAHWDSFWDARWDTFNSIKQNKINSRFSSSIELLLKKEFALPTAISSRAYNIQLNIISQARLDYVKSYAAYCQAKLDDMAKPCLTLPDALHLARQEDWHIQSQPGNKQSLLPWATPILANNMNIINRLNFSKFDVLIPQFDKCLWTKSISSSNEAIRGGNFLLTKEKFKSLEKTSCTKEALYNWKLKSSGASSTSLEYTAGILSAKLDLSPSVIGRQQQSLFKLDARGLIPVLQTNTIRSAFGKQQKTFSWYDSTIKKGNQSKSILKQTHKYDSFLFLRKYLRLITKHIKTNLLDEKRPYKMRLSYLPQVNILESKLAHCMSNSLGHTYTPRELDTSKQVNSLQGGDRNLFKMKINKKTTKTPLKLPILNLMKYNRDFSLFCSLREQNKEQKTKNQKNSPMFEKLFLSYLSLSKSKKSNVNKSLFIVPHASQMPKASGKIRLDMSSRQTQLRLNNSWLCPRPCLIKVALASKCKLIKLKPIYIGSYSSLFDKPASQMLDASGAYAGWLSHPASLPVCKPTAISSAYCQAGMGSTNPLASLRASYHPGLEVRLDMSKTSIVDKVKFDKSSLPLHVVHGVWLGHKWWEAPQSLQVQLDSSNKVPSSSKIKKNTLISNQSPLMLLKNRLFINKELLHATRARIASINLLYSHSDHKKEHAQPDAKHPASLPVCKPSKGLAGIRDWKLDTTLSCRQTQLRKKYQLKIKRRLKKMKKETRRRKKRKIFYPRPTWITFSMYKKYVDSRYLRTSGSFCQLGDQLRPNVTQGVTYTWRKDPKIYSFWLSHRNFNHQKDKIVYTEALFKNTNDFYKISKTVFHDLRRVLMKSNWLRSYLNPYLEKIKTIYKEMQTFSKKMQVYDYLQSFISFIYSGSSLGHTPDLKNFSLMEESLISYKNGFKNDSLCPPTSQMPEASGAYAGWLLKRSSHLASLPVCKPSLGTSYHTGLEVRHDYVMSSNLLEYNRIIYQLMQRIILNIRDNLTLNGQLKNKSKKLGKNVRTFIKRDYTKRDSTNGINTNQNAVLWSKIIKNNVLKLSRSFINYGYDESSPYNNASQVLSRNNFYWALNKSATLSNTSFNTSYVKKLWETYKIREVNKSNKTKKILFNLIMKYNSVLKPTNSLDGYNNILLQNISNQIPNLANEVLFIPGRMTQLAQPDALHLARLDMTLSCHHNESLKALFSFPIKDYIIKSEQKLINIENKLKLLGLYSPKLKKQQNYKNSYFKFLKQQLFKEKNFYTPYNNKMPTQLSFDIAKQGGVEKVFLNIKQKYLNNAGIYTPSDLNRTKIAKMSNNNIYWWSFLKIGGMTPASWVPINEQHKHLQNEQHKGWGIGHSDKKIPLVRYKQGSFHLTQATLISFLFHFASLVSFISLGGVRTLIKFYYILITKITKILSNVHKIRLFPKSYSFGKNQQFKNNLFINSDTIPSNARSIRSRAQPDAKHILGREPRLTLKTNNISLNNFKFYFLKYLTAQSRMTKLSLMKGYIHWNRNTSWNEPRFLFTKTKVPQINVNILDSQMPEASGKVRLDMSSQQQNITEISIQQKNDDMTDAKPLTGKKLSYFSFINKNPKFLICFRVTPIALVGPKKQFFENLSMITKTSLMFLTQSYKGSFPARGFASGEVRHGSRALNTQHELSIQGQARRFLGPPGGWSYAAMSSNLKKNQLKVMYNSYLKLSIFSQFAYKISFYTYLLLLKSIDILAIPASFIYKFFEKPGEYVVENLAYSFLVEWSADLISTIPDTVDTTQAVYFNKINRNFSPILFLNLGWANFVGPVTPGGYASQTFLFALTNSVLKRFLNSSFLVFIQQLCEPDLDYINRQKKGIIFWDIWGEYLKTVAEENSINIYELTTDKEEQIKLLSKYEEAMWNFNSNTYFSAGDQYLGLSPDKIRFSVAKASTKYTKHSLYSLIQKTNLTTQYDKNRSVKIPVKEKMIIPTSPARGIRSTSGKVRHGYNMSSELTSISHQLHKKNYNGWAVSQFLSYQGKDTDLFIDLHPPKSFSTSLGAASLKYSFSVQQPIGSIVCQIFSGIFYKQISKNILVVGSSGLEKSLLIQAIAGETELKIITDNAHRYAMVYRGVAVGIKFLRDVFEALSVHTPCIFLMEDIHAIGERRPFLIDEASPNASGLEATYNKNQSMQGLFLKEKSSASRESETKNNKHLLSHYKKPYKEPRSLATNHFSFTFLFGDMFTKIRKNEIRLSGATLSSQVIKKENESKYKNQSIGFSQLHNNNSKLKEKLNINSKNIYPSSLLIKSSNDELLSSPASQGSPFSVLILKEATKLKHKKVVKEMPWFGLPGEQYSLVSKYNYSIRVKVALLADLILSNLSVKLDMITDLLVIIDSVKGNRGFVVFATTHVPYILDPALRRPGRFDETISLPLIPALYSRWANYRYNVQYLTTSLFQKYTIPLNSTFNKGTSLNLTKYNLISNNAQEKPRLAIDELINYIYIKGSTFPARCLKASGCPKISALNTNTNLSVKSTLKYALSLKKFKENKTINLNKTEHMPFNASASAIASVSVSEVKTVKFSNKQSLKVKAKNYSYACKSLIYLTLYSLKNKTELTDPTRCFKASGAYVGGLQSSPPASLPVCKPSLGLHPGLEVRHDYVMSSKNKTFSLKWPSMLQNSNSTLEDYSVYLSLFSNPVMFKFILISLIGGKLGENFAIEVRHDSRALNTRHESSIQGQARHITEGDMSYAGMSSNMKNQFLCSTSRTFNFDKDWKYGSLLLFSYIQKRQCSALNKSLAFCSTKLLSFNNKYALMEAPSPPISNILLPAKRYENYKRTFNNQYGTLTSQHNFGTTISDKIQVHQQQRMLKRLYKYPIKEFFSNAKGISHILKGKVNDTTSNFSTFNNSSLVLGPLEKTSLASKKINKLSSVNSCYKNILYNRHKTYLTNQWWNGQQGEHNPETTFLSDIDWRYTFVPSIGDIHIDFPDSEQFYNPRNRRWILTNGDWNYWFNIQAELKDIYSHYTYECFTTAYKYLDQNREIIDFYAEILHQTPLLSDLKERDLLNLYKRFFAV
jgi:hypothetical protein